MESENKPVFGTRLKLARKMAGMSLQDLSDILGNRVSKQSLNKYEMGQMNPTSEVLLLLAKTLNVKPEYFLKQKQAELGSISFRKKASLTKKDEEAIIEKARDYLERHIELEFILAIENKFSNPLSDRLINNKDDVEYAANRLREYWELGTNPISNIIEMLEFKGIKVFLINDVEDIDGFSAFTSNNIPLVVVNTRDRSIERVRFTVIHELAHLLLIFDAAIKDDHKTIEILCHHFSSCFLIPSKRLTEMLGANSRQYIAINELINIKEYYGISIRAIVHRLKDLKIITDTYYQKWVIYMSKTYGSKKEPGNYKGDEKSNYFEQLISRAISEGLISLSKAASLYNVSTNAIRKLFAGVNE
jgi:Zn-dependent peptidase ImmA (M78 family)/DNA-binding XRE family transcriptional regulator